MKSKHVTQVLKLYKLILRLHRNLPADLRFIGDSYAKEEFRLHKKCKPDEARIFLNEWQDYAANMLGQVSPTRADGNQDEQPRAAEAAAVPAQAPGEPQAPAEPQNAAAEQAQVLVPRASNAPARNPRLRIRSQPPVGEPRIILRPTPRYGVDLPQEVIIRFSSDQMHRFFELEQAAGERVGENGPVRARIEQYVEACAHHQPQPIVRAPTNAPAIEYDAGQAAVRVDAVEPMDIAEDNGDAEPGNNEAGPGANAAQNGKADKD